MNNDEKICSLQKVTTKDCMDYASERTDSYLVLDTAEKVECQTKLAETVHVYVENYAIDLVETDNFVLFGTEFLQEQNKLKYRFRFEENVLRIACGHFFHEHCWNRYFRGDRPLLNCSWPQPLDPLTVQCP